jgi:hypothetical protein
VTSSLSLPKPVAASVRPAWSLPVGGRLRGLSLAREKGWVLSWDDGSWLHLLGVSGARQGQVRLTGQIGAAAVADDGSVVAAGGIRGEVWWLAPDLSVRWQKSVPAKVVAVALDPFGQYAAVADAQGGLHFFDRHARSIARAQAPRPLHHLTFVPAAPYVLGSADYGLVACYDLAGHCSWRDGLVAHVGSLAVSGTGDAIVLACFSEGLQRYTLAGRNEGRQQLKEPCRLVALDFEGRSLVAAGLSHRLLLADRDGGVSCEHALDRAPVGLVVGALGRLAVVAFADGTIQGFDLTPGVKR